MADYWAYIAAFGSALTFIAIAPYLLGLAGLTMNLSLETTDPALLEQGVRLMMGALVAMVPLSFGGIALFVLFQVAEAQA